MNTAFDVMTGSPVGIAAFSVVIGTIVVSAGLATWLIVKSKYGPAAETNEGKTS